MLHPDKHLYIAAGQLGYPNGIDVTPDGKTLFISETFADTISMFDIDEKGRLVNQDHLIQLNALGFNVSFNAAGLPENPDQFYPDGMTLVYLQLINKLH